MYVRKREESIWSGKMNFVQDKIVKNRIDTDEEYAYSLLYYLIIDSTLLTGRPMNGVQGFTYHTKGDGLSEIDINLRLSKIIS